MLAKTSPVSYKTQLHGRAEPDIVHADKLLPYQADFEEELHSWLDGEESDGHRVAEIQTADNTPSEPSPEATMSSPSPAVGGSLDIGLASDQEADLESDAEKPSTSAIQPRRGIRPRQCPERYSSIREVRPVPGLTHKSSFRTHMLLGWLMPASTQSRCETNSGCSRGEQHLGE